MADKTPVSRVSNLVVALSLVSLVVLAVVDMLSAENVPLVVYGIIGGIAFGADKESIPTIFGGKK
jgi:hypothetical protein